MAHTGLFEINSTFSTPENQPGWNLLPEQDLPWIQGYNRKFDASEDAFDKLHALGEVGSIPLTQAVDTAEKDTIIEARRNFLLELGIGSKTLESLQKTASQRAYLGLSSTFVASQRMLHASGFPPQRILRLYSRRPSMINASSCGWSRTYHTHQESLAPLADQGITAEWIDDTFRKYPEVFSILPQSLAMRTGQLLDLGLTARALHKQPSLLTVDSQVLAKKLVSLQSLGLKDMETINRAPVVLSLATATVASKINNLQRLGLDANQIIKRNPQILSSAEPSVAHKTAYIQRMLTTLGWNGDISEVINTAPVLLITSLPKLRLLARIAATSAHQDRRNMTPSQIQSASIIPLESYVAATYNEHCTVSSTASDGITIAKRMSKTPPAQRIAIAKEATAPWLNKPGQLGKIALMYQSYATGTK